MDFFRKNSNFFAINFPHYFHQINSINTDKLILRQTPHGFSLAMKTKRGELALSSKINPLQEAQQIAKRFNLQADHFIILGLANFYLPETILQLADRQSRVLIIEPNPEIIKLSFQAIDWEELLKKNVFLLAGEDRIAITDSLYQLINFPVFKKLEIIENPTAARIFSQQYTPLRNFIEDEIRTILYNIQTQMAEGELVLANILKNLPQLIKTIPLKLLQNSFCNCPAIIVAAGPSLDRNILQLKKVDRRALIIAVDTALKPLLAHNIQPDFTVAADPSYKNWLHFLGTEGKLHNFIVAELGVCNQIFKDFHSKIITATIGRDLEEIIEDNFTIIGTLPAWGSVISFALAFAIFIGANPVVFTGLDFAYSDGRNHCRHSWWEENYLLTHIENIRLAEYEKLTITGNRKIFPVMDITQRTVYTSDRLYLYKKYLVNYLQGFPQIVFLNASEGGILHEIEAIRLEDFISRFLSNRKQIIFPAFLKKTERDFFTSEDYQKLKLFFRKKRAFLMNYLQKIELVLKETGPEKLNPEIGFSYRQFYRLRNLKDELYTDIATGILVERWSSVPIFKLLKSEQEIKNRLNLQEELSALIANYREYFATLQENVAKILELLKNFS